MSFASVLNFSNKVICITVILYSLFLKDVSAINPLDISTSAPITGAHIVHDCKYVKAMFTTCSLQFSSYRYFWKGNVANKLSSRQMNAKDNH